MQSTTKAYISNVASQSPAQRAGIHKGDAICLAMGQPLRDVIDWRWNASEESVCLLIEDASGKKREIELHRDFGEDWGIEFTDVIFDKVKTCCNNCLFCFMRQLPDDVRPTLTLRDDDFRLSFLSGNFVTLTNLSTDDIERIKEQHLSPLRISLHAYDPQVRAKLMGKSAQNGIANLEHLLAARIEFDAQIVLVPGINDGKVLTQTLDWAYKFDGIRNVGIVPVGFTSHKSAFDKGFDNPSDAIKVIDAIHPFQERAIKERGYPWVFAADEFYRNAYADDLLDNLPPAKFYGDFDMFEDGIGIIRSMADELMYAIENTDVLSWPKDKICYYICGFAMMPQFAQALSNSKLCEILIPFPIENKWLGGNVNVTGLLTGSDISSEIISFVKKDETNRFYFAIPDVIFNDDGVTLDNMSISDIRNKVAKALDDKAISKRIFVVSSNPIDYISEISQYLSL